VAKCRGLANSDVDSEGRAPPSRRSSSRSRGVSERTYGSLVTIAADPERAQDLRLRAVDALGGFERGRLTGRFLAGPRVQVASDVAVPPRVRAHVVDRLQSLAEDRHGIVAERARAALVR
jgi:hypothetical protein